MWALDFMGVINPSSCEGHKFILVATEYYTKWVEMNLFKNSYTETRHQLHQGIYHL